jgi:hypothetical protein
MLVYCSFYDPLWPPRVIPQPSTASHSFPQPPKSGCQTYLASSWISRPPSTPSPWRHGRMRRGGHGLPKVSPGPAMSYPWWTLGKPFPDTLGGPVGDPWQTLGRPPLKQTYGRFRGGLPTGRVACSCLLPLWTHHALRLCIQNSTYTCLVENQAL